MTIVVVENGCEKRHFLVWNRVRIWRPCRHTPCKSFLEYPPGMIRTKLFLVWLNFRLTFKYYHRETEIRTVRFLTENLRGKTGLGRLSDCDRLCVLCTPGGGGYFWEFMLGVCSPVFQILTLFQTKKCHFSHPFFGPGLWNPCPFSHLASKKLCHHYSDQSTNTVKKFLKIHFKFAYYFFLLIHEELKWRSLP